MPLLDLPNELLLDIASCLLLQKDVSSLSQTSRHLHNVLDGYLYRYNVHHDNASALAFGAFHGLRTVVEKSLRVKLLDINAPPASRRGKSFLAHKALCNAIRGKHRELVQLLLANGADVERGCRPDMKPLLTATRRGNVDLIELLLDNRAVINIKSRDGRTPLHYTAQRGDIASVQLLLSRGAETLAKDRWGDTALHDAAESGSTACIQTLLDNGADILATNDKGITPLCRAAKRGHTLCVRELLDRGAHSELQSTTGREALYRAMSRDHAETAQLLLQNGVVLERKVDILYECARQGHSATLEMVLQHGVPIDSTVSNMTALYVAARSGHQKIVKRLLDAGADVTFNGVDNYTPLMIAVACDQIDVVKLLLGRDLYLDFDSYREAAQGRETLLWTAVSNGSWSVAKFLLEIGANPNLLSTIMQLHPLLSVVIQANLQMLELMLSKGADPRLAATRKSALLFWAVEARSVDMVRLLLEYGADPNEDCTDFEKQILIWELQCDLIDPPPFAPLPFAIKLGLVRVAELLLDYGADPHVPQWKHLTNLVQVMKLGDCLFAEKMINKGFDVNEPDDNGDTPISVASKDGNAELVKLLLRYGSVLDSSPHGCSSELQRVNEASKGALTVKRDE